jgi:hypothetical protein
MNDREKMQGMQKGGCHTDGICASLGEEKTKSQTEMFEDLDTLALKV